MKHYDFTGKYRREMACLIWTGYVQSGGYGQVEHEGRRWLVHRLAWRNEYGEIPPGMLVLHHCDTPRCIELQHLRLGTARENMADCIARGRYAKKHRPHTRVRKLTDEQIVEIRASTEKPKDLAKRLGISWVHVYAIKAGRRKALVHAQ